MGGRPVIRGVAAGGADAAGVLERARTIIDLRFGGRFSLEVTRMDDLPTGRLLARLDDGTLAPPDEVDLVVRSVTPDIGEPGEVAGHRSDLVELIRRAKDWGATMVLLNACTFDPDDLVHTYHGTDETFAERVHRFDQALIHLSVSEGISIVDIDHVVAVMGAAGRLDGRLGYPDEALEEGAEDLVRVMEEIGFFEQRPLLEQAGAVVE